MEKNIFSPLSNKEMKPIIGGQYIPCVGCGQSQANCTCQCCLCGNQVDACTCGTVKPNEIN